MLLQEEEIILRRLRTTPPKNNAEKHCPGRMSGKREMVAVIGSGELGVDNCIKITEMLHRFPEVGSPTEHFPTLVAMRRRIFPTLVAMKRSIYFISVAGYRHRLGYRCDPSTRL